MAERQIILSNMEALVGADLSKAFKAVRGEKVRNMFEKFYSFLINEHIIPPVFPLIQLNVSIETFIICTAPMPSHNPKAPPSSEKNLVKEKLMAFSVSEFIVWVTVRAYLLITGDAKFEWSIVGPLRF